MSIVKVNDFLLRSETEELRIDAINSGEIYQDANFLSRKVLNCIRRFESNIKVYGSTNEASISGFPIIDDDEVRWIQGKAGEFNYIHFGAILFGVTPLFPNASKITGTVSITDPTMLDEEQGHIASFNITFGKGPAFFSIRPGHCLSISDPHLQSALKVSIQFPGLRAWEGRELVGLDIGVMYRLANSARFLSSGLGSDGWAAQEIQGAERICYRPGLSATQTYKLEHVDVSCKRRSRGLLLPKRMSRSRKYKAKLAKEGEVNGGANSEAERSELGKFRSSSVRYERSGSELVSEYESSGDNQGRNSVSGEEISVVQLHRSRARPNCSRQPASSSGRTSGCASGDI
nr:putative movement protein [Tea A virus]